MAFGSSPEVMSMTARREPTSVLVVGRDGKLESDLRGSSVCKKQTFVLVVMQWYNIYIVGCRSDCRDNLILRSPVERNKTFDGVFEFYYY